MLRRLLPWLKPLVFLGGNPITLAGAVLTTSSALTIIGAILLDLLRERPLHPYTGIILFLILPGLFVVGLLLIPLGALWQRRRLKAKGELPADYPPIDLRHAIWQRALALVGAATFLNVAILSAASYQGVKYMDSTEFCGVTCHSVMAPEYAAFKESAHSRVGCVECHIGPGAPWFVRSKLSGTRQLFAVALKTYSRPIPSPVKHLGPPARPASTATGPRNSTETSSWCAPSTRATSRTRRSRPCWCSRSAAAAVLTARASTGAISTPRSASPTSRPTSGGRSSPG